MQLFETEANLVERLRTNERQWDRVRWTMAITGLFVLAGSIYILRRIWDTVAPDQILIIVCTVVAPISGIALFVGLLGMLYAFMHWNGCPVRKLLLKLSDEMKSR